MMSTEIKNIITAIVTHDREKVQSGFAPIFYSTSETESEKLALYLAKITQGMVHNLENGVYLIVKH
ncbi:MAG: hypothetical protein PWR27_951 [Petroclostridium sp.]|jgi:hypothetical protein|uniref:capping complex subunit for YIEGIA n=1 Tax=Petroclostridium xylanilyticum TaxID=1792311 RepID=UPI00241FFCB5|nr:hypothetical protein [Petroclostridium xylanilyticum]MDK2810242.1 hypothetical protein [Petroclostridium sp.]